jgi:hypothetical protein
LAAQQLPSCEAAKSYRFELGRQALGSHFAVTSQGTWKALGRGGFGHLEATWKARRASGAGAARHHVAPFFLGAARNAAARRPVTKSLS